MIGLEPGEGTAWRRGEWCDLCERYRPDAGLYENGEWLCQRCADSDPHIREENPG